MTNKPPPINPFFQVQPPSLGVMALTQPLPFAFFQDRPTATPPFNHPPPNYQTGWVFMTRELAADLLKHNDVNRHTSEREIARFRRKMELGEWFAIHQGVAIYTNGAIADGQHRLQAIATSTNLPHGGVWMLLTINIPLEYSKVIDAGRSRTIHHHLQIAARTAGAPVPSGKAITVAMVLTGIDRPLRDAAITQDTYEKHAEAINFIIQVAYPTHKRGLGGQHVKAPLVRAYYHTKDKDELIKFGNALTRATVEDNRDNWASMLHSYIMSSDKDKSAYDVYAKTESALFNFLNKVYFRHASTSEDGRKSGSKLTPAKYELFPLDGERPMQSIRESIGLSLAATSDGAK